jgi:capsid portal protein
MSVTTIREAAAVLKAHEADRAAPAAQGGALNVVPDGPDEDHLADIDASLIPIATPRGLPYNLFDEARVASGETFIEPPDDPVAMLYVYRLTPYLRPIVDAFVANVYTAPFVLKPKIPFDRPETAKRYVARALTWRKAKKKLERLERAYVQQVQSYIAGTSQAAPVPPPRLVDIDVPVPSEAEVEKELEALKARAMREYTYAMERLASLPSGSTWTDLWDITGQDQEATGTAYWEVLRNATGEPVRVQRLSPIAIRARKPSAQLVETTTLRAMPDYTYRAEREERVFFQFAQLEADPHQAGAHGRVICWFKEYGDPRVCSKTTGRYYETLDDFYRAEWSDRDTRPPMPATEILVLCRPYAGSSVYGMAPAAGIYPDLAGARELAEENRKAILDENIPSMMLFVGGGLIGKRGYKRINDALKERRAGRKSILVLEANSPKSAVPGGPTVQPTLEVHKMRSEQQNDALFTNHDRRVEEKADAVYRMPRVGLGKDKGANRAVADFMGRFVQDEVYGPRRVRKDDAVNTHLFPFWGVTLWTYHTPATKPRDPQVLAEILKTLTEGSILSPNEAREEAGEIFNRQLEDLQGLWTRLPPRIMTTLLQTKNQELAAILAGRDPEALDKLSERIKQALLTGGEASPEPDTQPALPTGSESTDLD